MENRNTTAMPEKVRYYELDLMRIILMAYVILGHSRYLNFVPYTFDYAVENYNSGLLWYVNAATDFAYSFHMPLFFALSGMVAFVTRKKTFVSFDKLVINKAKRLLIPYFVYGIFWMIPLRILADVYDTSNIGSAITNLCNFTDQSHLWFLHVLFGIFVCFYPFYLIYKKTGSVVFTFFASYLFTILIKQFPLNFLNFGQIIAYLPYFSAGFAVGCLIYKDCDDVCKNTPRLYKLNGFFELAVSLSLFVALITAQRAFAFSYVPLNVIVMGTSIYLLSLFIVKHTRFASTRVFNLLNKHCMGMYLFHDPLNFAVLFLAYRTGFLRYQWGCYLMFILRSVGIAGLSLLLSVLTSKIKTKIAEKKYFIPITAMILTVLFIFAPTAIKYKTNQVLNHTDANWTNGILNYGSDLLLENDAINNRKYISKVPVQLQVGDECYDIVAAYVDGNNFIRIQMESHETAMKFGYPTKYSIIYNRKE